MKRGFTLVELLVAVLIIGVLTAMALPMYQKSVDKSRYATLMPLAKNIKDAQEAFYLGGGKYSKDLGSLDVRVPGNPSGNTATLSDGTTVEISNTDGTGYVKMGKENLNNYYVMYQDRSGSYPGEIHCEALSDNDRANELCQNLGGTKIDQALTSGYTAYVLVGTGEKAGGGTLPVTKQLTSTEACTIYTYPYISSCTKYVYDDGTSVERYTDDSGNSSSRIYDEDGNEIGNFEQLSSGTWAVGTVTGHFWANADGDVTAIGMDTDTQSPSGMEYGNYYMNIGRDGDYMPYVYDITYGDTMEGNGEKYRVVLSDGSWYQVELFAGGSDNYAVRYDARYGTPETSSWAGSAAAQAALEAAQPGILAAWEAAGYSTSTTAIQEWIARDRATVLSDYCALDPEHSYCQ